MELWDDIEESNENKHFDNNSQDLSDKTYRELLIKSLVHYSIENDETKTLFKSFSTSMKDASDEIKEEILETFTKESKLLNSNNTYLKNPIKGMRLVSSIITKDTLNDKSKLEISFEKFDEFLKKDFIEFSNQIAIANEAELYSRLMSIRNELQDDVKFSELANKTHIGIGGSFSAGKSSFLNSILNRSKDDEDILPVDTIPTTSIPTYIVKNEDKKSKNSDCLDIYTFNKEGSKSKIDKESLKAISHEFNKVYNFSLTSVIEKIVIDVETMDYDNIAFLDTPGYSKADGDEETDKNIAKNHLRNIDSMIWLIDADNGIIRDGDIQFIKSLDFIGEILFILNKADKKPLSDVEKIIEVIKTTLHKANIEYVDVIAYSSHESKEYLTENSIKNFLKKRNIVRAINFQAKLFDIMKEYKIHINEVKDKSSEILELFNKLDLYSGDVLLAIDNFEELLVKVRIDKDKNKKDYKLYTNISNTIDTLMVEIDNEFNHKLGLKKSNIQKEDKYRKELELENLKTRQEYIYAIELYTKIIDLNSKNKASSVYYSVLNQRAMCYKSIGNYDMSIAEYSKIIDMLPDVEEYYEKRIESYMLSKKYKNAIDDYNVLIEINPTYKKWKIDKEECSLKLEIQLEEERIIEENRREEERIVYERMLEEKKLDYENEQIKIKKRNELILFVIFILALLVLAIYFTKWVFIPVGAYLWEHIWITLIVLFIFMIIGGLIPDEK